MQLEHREKNDRSFYIVIKTFKISVCSRSATSSFSYVDSLFGLLSFAAYLSVKALSFNLQDLHLRYHLYFFPPSNEAN